MSDCYLEFPLWKGRDLDKSIWIAQGNKDTPADLSIYDSFRFIATDAVEGNQVFQKQSTESGQITIDLSDARIDIHILKADTNGVDIPVPDHGPYGANKGPAVVALPFDLIGTRNDKDEQLAAGIIHLYAPATLDLS